MPEETPIALAYNKRNYAVMLATPADVSDFATGFSLTERVVDQISEIIEIDIVYSQLGVDVRLKIEDQLVERLDLRQRRRNLVGRAGCGVCGLENAEELHSPLPVVSEVAIELEQNAILKAAGSFSAQQALNQKTKSVHGAAWATIDGDIRLIREDIGRHNALDKLLGARALGEQRDSEGFVFLSSRCSYELVDKAAWCGVKALVSISAPSAFAVRRAAQSKMSLYCRAGEAFAKVK